MNELTGEQRIAVLLLAMGDRFTADVFTRMDRHEIAAKCRAYGWNEPPVFDNYYEEYDF